jgi:hypothetical protein
LGEPLSNRQKAVRFLAMGVVVAGVVVFGLIIQGHMVPNRFIEVAFPLAPTEVDVYKGERSDSGGKAGEAPLPPLWLPDVEPQQRGVLKDGRGQSAVFSTERSPAAVLAFYRERLKSEGWREVGAESEGKGAGDELAVFMRADGRFYLRVSQDRGRTSCQSVLMLGPRGE